MSTLHYRPVRGDMLETYKILSGKCDTTVVPHLKTTGIKATRGNDLRIFKTRFKYDLHKFHFTSHSQNPRIMRWSLAMQPYRYTVKYIRGSENVAADYLSRSNWDDHSTCNALWCVKSMYIVIVNMLYYCCIWHCELYEYDVTLQVSCKRCKMLFDNTVLNICRGLYKMSKKIIHYIIYMYMMSKKYTLSDNMCLVHISAIVTLTVMCADRMYMQS